MSPLNDEETLAAVLEYVGPCEHLYVAWVCREWRADYYKQYPKNAGKTSIAAVCGSPARIKLACEIRQGFKALWAQLDVRIQTLAGRLASQETLTTALESGLTLGEFVTHGSAIAGDYRKSLWLLQRVKRQMTDALCCNAATGGSVELMQYLRDEGCSVISTTVMKAAAAAGQLKMVQYLQSIGGELAETVMDAAARGAHMHVLTWLRERECPYNLTTLWLVAHKVSKAELLYWLLDEFGAAIAQNYGTDLLLQCAVNCKELPAFQRVAYLTGELAGWRWTDIFSHAIEQGSHDILEWIWNNHASSIQLIQYLYGSAFPQNLERQPKKATVDVLRMIRWLHEVVQCPWDPFRLACTALYHAQIEVLEYLLQQGEVFTSEELTQLLKNAGDGDLNQSNNLAQQECCKRLRQLGAEWPDLFFYANPWNKAMIAWARSEGMPVEYGQD